MGEREVRAGIERLKNGAGELAVIALVMPLFLVGLELATAGLSTGGPIERGPRQVMLDRALYVIYGVALLALALRARIGAARARRLLPDLLSSDGDVRAAARERLLRLGGSAKMRALADRVAARGVTMLAAFFVIAGFVWLFLPVPNPVWLTIFAGTIAAMDVRWRALVADAAEQLR